jgi:uncharacterized protein
MVFRITDKYSGAILADRARRATTFRERLQGLLGQTALLPGEALHLAPCRSVHTFFMRFPVDVLFLDSEDAVVRAIHSLQPWRATRLHRDALSALELPAGTLAKSGTGVGHRIRFERTDLAELA